MSTLSSPSTGWRCLRVAPWPNGPDARSSRSSNARARRQQMSRRSEMGNRTPGEARQVTLREVGPRDGFQNEPEAISTEDKVRLINALGMAGYSRIEVASFVRPDVIPQLADGVAVLRGLDLPDTVQKMVVVPNAKGLDNALRVRDLR